MQGARTTKTITRGQLRPGWHTQPLSNPGPARGAKTGSIWASHGRPVLPFGQGAGARLPTSIRVSWRIFFFRDKKKIKSKNKKTRKKKICLFFFIYFAFLRRCPSRSPSRSLFRKSTSLFRHGKPRPSRQSVPVPRRGGGQAERSLTTAGRGLGWRRKKI